jgi:hypothetical protein
MNYWDMEGGREGGREDEKAAMVDEESERKADSMNSWSRRPSE